MTPCDPSTHHRRSIRLQGYDYARAGAYFVTICVGHHVCMLGRVIDGRAELTGAGQIVAACWDDLPNHYPQVQLYAFVIMPNHVHGIIALLDEERVTATRVVGAGLGAGAVRTAGPVRKTRPVATRSRHGLGEIVRGFKTYSARRINALRRTQGVPFWQRNYWEHVIRNEAELAHVREYIANNPARWEEDRHYRTGA